MNPLTLVKRTQQINLKEAALGISEQASWHAKYNDSAYVFVGGIPFELTEGDLLAVFAQYGEIVDVNLVKDKGTGKSKGFAFVAYEDQRSTNLAVDNLNGAQVLGRTIRVDHCSKYKKKEEEEEDDETRRQKREERGVCRAFQKGQCDRGDSCRFSHDEKRAANTGWGAEEDRQSKWANDKFDDPRKNGHSGQSSRNMKDDRSSNKDLIESRRKDDGAARRRRQEGSEWKSRDQGSRGIEKRAENGKGRNYEEELDRPHANRKSRHFDDDDSDIRDGKRLRRSDSESLLREEQESREGHRKRAYVKDSSPRRQKMDDDEQREDRANKRDEKRTTRYESDSYQREERQPRGGDKRSNYGRDSSPHLRRTDDDRGRRSHR